MKSCFHLACGHKRLPNTTKRRPQRERKYKRTLLQHVLCRNPCTSQNCLLWKGLWRFHEPLLGSSLCCCVLSTICLFMGHHGYTFRLKSHGWDISMRRDGWRMDVAIFFSNRWTNLLTASEYRFYLSEESEPNTRFRLWRHPPGLRVRVRAIIVFAIK